MKSPGNGVTGMRRAFATWRDLAALDATSHWFFAQSAVFRFRTACLRQAAARLPKHTHDQRRRPLSLRRSRCSDAMRIERCLLAASWPPLASPGESSASQASTAEHHTYSVIFTPTKPHDAVRPSPSALSCVSLRFPLRRWRAKSLAWAAKAGETVVRSSGAARHHLARSMWRWAKWSRRHAWQQERLRAAQCHWGGACLRRWLAWRAGNTGLDDLGSVLRGSARLARARVRLRVLHWRELVRRRLRIERLLAAARAATLRRTLRRFRAWLVRGRAEDLLLGNASVHAARRRLALLRRRVHSLVESRLAHAARVGACRCALASLRRAAALQRWRAVHAIWQRLLFMRLLLSVGSLAMAVRTWRDNARHRARLGLAWRVCLRKRLQAWHRLARRNWDVRRSVSWAPLPGYVVATPVAERRESRESRGSDEWAAWAERG